MSTGATCHVEIDGLRLPDGQTGDPELDPTGLSGLVVAWGRGTTMDQPETATCTLQVLDQSGGDSFLGWIRTGASLSVTSTITTFPDPTVSTFVDPSFEAAEPTTIVSGATAARTTRAAHSGVQSLALVPREPNDGGWVIVPPAPFAAPGADPDAWDAIPPTSAGQVWSVAVWVLAPLGSIVSLRPVLFRGPHATDVEPAQLDVVTADGTGAWQQLALDYAPQLNAAWVGVQVSARPAGPRWIDVDPARTWLSLDPLLQWADLGRVLIDDVTVLAPAGGVDRYARVFDGRITDVSLGWDTAPVIEVTAADFTADLDNRDVGGEPWLVESVATRVARIMTLAGLPIVADVDASLGSTLVTWRDVDNQAATGLLRELAQSVDGVLWAAVHETTGPYVRLEDPANRTSISALVMGEDGLVHVEISAGRELDACKVLRDPVSFVQTVSDISTRVAVSWLEQTLDDDGNPAPTDRTVTVIDADRELEVGTRRISLSTQLQAQADAEEVADRLLARALVDGWRVGGLTVEDSDLEGSDAALIGALLDGTGRIGLAIRLTNLPSWSPTSSLGLYVEGGTYSFIDGEWLLELVMSRASAQGASGSWAELDPSWRWVDMAPDVSWNDLIGVASAETISGL